MTLINTYLEILVLILSCFHLKKFSANSGCSNILECNVVGVFISKVGLREEYIPKLFRLTRSSSLKLSRNFGKSD